MTDPRIPSLPFITRDMFQFEHGTSFELEMVAYSESTALISIIGATREGIFKFNFNHTGDGTEDTQKFRIPDVPTFLTAFTDNVGIERGEFWGSIFLVANGERILKLTSGYISKQSSLNWPNTQSESELSGGGKFKVVFGADPAAGANASDVVPANEHWILKAYSITLVAAASAASRRVHLKLTMQGQSSMIEAFPTVDQIISETKTYIFAPYGQVPDETDNNIILVPIPPDIHLVAGDTIATATLNLQAGDNFDIPAIYVEKFIED